MASIPCSSCSLWVRVPPSAGISFINVATARFADISFGSQGRNAVSVLGGAHNFLRRNKPLANL